MRAFICSVKRARRWGLLSVCLFIGLAFLWFPDASANGVRRGLAVCGSLLIPSLFPFMVLANFVIISGLADGIGRRLDPLMNRLFGLSGGAAIALIVSLFGGYPSGATAVSQLVTRDAIDREEGKRLLCCCVNAGPAFMIGGIGAGILGSVKAGVLLLIAHWIASLIVLLCMKRRRIPAVGHPLPSVDVGAAVSQSVNATCRSLIAMCGFVLLASACVSLTDALGGAVHASSLWRCLLSGVLEVSIGCMEATAVGGATPFLIGAFLGLGGLSVCGQIAAVTADHELISSRFFAARLLHALLGGCLSTILFRFCDPFDGAVAAGAQLSSVVAQNNTVAAVGLLSMMMMCVIFLATTSRRHPR